MNGGGGSAADERPPGERPPGERPADELPLDELPLDEHCRRVPAEPLRPYVAWYTGYRQRGVPPGRHRGLPSPFLTLIFTLDEPVDRRRVPKCPSRGLGRRGSLGGPGPVTAGPAPSTQEGTVMEKGTPEPQVWPALRAHDARALIRFLVDAFGFEETVVYGDGDRVDDSAHPSVHRERHLDNLIEDRHVAGRAPATMILVFVYALEGLACLDHAAAARAQHVP